MEDQENNNTINGNNVQERAQCYRDLLDEAQEITESDEVGLQTAKKIKNILTVANLLNDQYDIRDKVTNPEEILLDSFVISSVSNVLVKCTKSLEVFSVNYEPLDFASKITKAIKTEETLEQLDFLKLLEDARDIIPNTIECSFLYGTCDISTLPIPKEKKQRVRVAQEKVAKKELIEVVKSQSEEGDGDTVIFLLKVLHSEFKSNNEKPLKYYDFVIDTNSYCASIENMFYCSFLIRDGKAKLELDKEGVPIIKPSSKKDLKAFRHSDGANTQMIVSLDMAEWNRIKSQEGHIQRHRRINTL